jgi:hypothetical protein
MYAPLAGKRLNGESLQPCFWKTGPRRKGRQTQAIPAARASPSTRDDATYEYVLAKSNQT